MKDIITELFNPQIKQIALHSINDNRKFKNCGITYCPDPAVGQGYFWVYPIRDMCAITIANLKFSKELELSYSHPEFLSIGYYAPQLIPYFNSNTFTSCYLPCSRTENHLVGAINKNSNFYADISQGESMKCISITMLPEYLYSFLPRYFSVDSQTLIQSVSNLGKNIPFAELEHLFAQMCYFNPAPSTANLYFESKILELLSLIQTEHENQILFPVIESIDEEIIAMIQRLATFIEANCEQRLTVEKLSKIFYTNKNKLSYFFRMIYGKSIYEYLQDMRIKKAKQLLEYPELSMHEISNSVGYKNQGSFSEYFKKATGISPTEYRRQICSHSHIR